MFTAEQHCTQCGRSARFYLTIVSLPIAHLMMESRTLFESFPLPSHNKCSQAFPVLFFFFCSSSVYYTEHEPKNKN